MIHRKANPILRLLYSQAEAKGRTTLSLTEVYWPYVDEEQLLADAFGCTEEIWKDINRLHNRFMQFKSVTQD